MRKSFVIVLCIIAALVAVTSPLQIVSAQDSSRNSGTISGVVLNEQRMPLAGGSVRLWRVYEDDSRVLQTGPIAITDATGRYRLNNVPPGTYLIESLSSVASDSQRRTVPLPESVFYRSTMPLPESVFYPDTPIANDARRIAVTVEQQIDWIDIVRRPRSLPRISGRVLNASGQPLEAMAGIGVATLRGYVWLSHASGSAGVTFFEREVSPASDGSFAFDHVQPGAYVLRGTLDGQPVIPLSHSLLRTSREVVMQAVYVGDNDVANVQLQLNPTRSVAGRVVIEGEGTRPAPSAFRFDAIQAEPGFDADALKQVAAAVSVFDNGSVVIEGLVGAGRVTYSGGPKGWYLATIRSANGEEIEGPIAAGLAEPLALVVKDDAVTLSGTLSGFDAANQPRLRVVLFPADRRQWWGWPSVRQTAPFADFPHYFFESVPPGEYFVAAYAATNDPLPAVDLQSRLNALSRVATRIVIPSRKHVSLDLPLVVPRW
jgi:hypothetical protein